MMAQMVARGEAVAGNAVTTSPAITHVVQSVVGSRLDIRKLFKRDQF